MAVPDNFDFSNTPISPKRLDFDYIPREQAEKPLVTIITPYYNTREIFNETATSVFRQSFQQWEWIIVNDGSQDSQALKILDDYRHSDKRIRVLDHPKNLGPGAARNTACHIAQSDYLVPLDSDDLLEPDALEKWLWFLVSHHEYSFVNSYSVGFDEQEYLWSIGFENGTEFLQENRTILTSMIRKSVYEVVGGIDENIRAGLEDWDFWLKCAAQSYWGYTIPEYLCWYRRRKSHRDRWADWDQTDQYRQYFKEKYPKLYEKGMPVIAQPPHLPNAVVPSDLPFRNLLQKRRKRLLMVLPWMVMGGADKFNLDLLRGLQRAGWEVSVVTTLMNQEQPWMNEFQRMTPDVFVLSNFLRLADFPRFLKYLIASRNFEAVFISNSEMGYWLLPFLRATFPEVTFLDYCHMEEEYWRNGGYPQYSVTNQPLLDLSVVSSTHLKNWMVGRGAIPEKIEICTTNIDCEAWKPDARKRAAIRAAYQILPGTPIILYAARLCEQKLPVVLAKTMHEVQKRGIDFACLVAGYGPDMGKLRSLVEAYELQDRVRLLGSIPNQKIKELMVTADIFFLPSKMEGIALTLYEAMAAGACVVGTEVGGQAELVTPECGVLVKPAEEEELVFRFTEVLIDLLRNPGKREQLRKRARQHIKQYYRIEQMEQMMLELLDRACHKQDRLTVQPDPDLANVSASNAVEYARLNNAVESLWAQNVSLRTSLEDLKQRSDELARLAEENLRVVPPASALTFFYFGFRSMFLGVYRQLEGVSPGVQKFKTKLKHLLVREKMLQ
jgi:glycosyltransferase involved in cell wall biosynthesis